MANGRSPFHAVVFGGMARNITQAAAKGMSTRGVNPTPAASGAPTPGEESSSAAHSATSRHQSTSSRHQE